jgi:hypothetical protein
MSDSSLVPTNKASILELVLSYLSNTKPVLMFIHLVWFTIVCAILSMTYLVSFHFTNLIDIYQEAHNIQKFNSNLVFSMQQDSAINANLNELVSKTHANRAYLFRYHNGLAAVSGVPFFFQTNTHEVISPGTPRVIQFEQHIPASINLAINNKFMMNQCAIIPKADEDKDSQNYWFFQNRGAKSIVRCPVFMPNGDLFGFVGVDFTDRVDIKDLNQIENEIKIVANSLALVFATKH